MRVKEFDDKLHEDPDFVWFTHSLFPKTITGAGKKAEAYSRLLTICRKAYNMAGTNLQADPAPPPEPEPVIMTGITAGDSHGEEADSDESERNSA